MNYINIINQVMILFLIMLIGYIARKKNVIDEPTNKGMSELLLGVTFPAMIIVSFNHDYSEEMLIKAMIILGISVTIHMSLVVISKILYKKYPENEKSVLRFITIFSNCGFMGYPIVGSIYGDIGIFYTAIYNISFNVLMFTIGIMLFTNKKDFKNLKKELLNPSLISIFIGLLIFIFSIKLPDPIFKTLSLLGSITTPLSMIVIGSMIAEIHIKNVFVGTHIYYGTFVRLIMTPLIVFIILKLFGATEMYLGIPVLISGMPAAANTAIMAQKYNADNLLASRFVFITTIISALTIPIILIAVQ